MKTKNPGANPAQTATAKSGTAAPSPVSSGSEQLPTPSATGTEGKSDAALIVKVVLGAVAFLGGLWLLEKLLASL